MEQLSGAAAASGARIGFWHELPAVLDRARDGARLFEPLHCRGFSYVFTAAPRFLIPFPQRIDLRFALTLPRALSHPPAVEHALRKHRCRHVVSESGRCAAFALGSARRETAGTVWYVYALQSDLALIGRPVLRDYLRGWRKVLFAAVLNAARAAQVAAVCLAPTDAVYGAAKTNRTYPLERVPDLWRQIYDRTAAEFGLAVQPVERPVNIQTTPHRRPFLCDTFHRLPIVRALKPSPLAGEGLDGG